MPKEIFLIFAAAVLALGCTPCQATEVLGYQLAATTRLEFLQKTEGDASRVLIPAKDDYTVYGYILQPKESEYPGLKRVAFMFDPNDRLCLVYIELPPEQYAAQVEKAKGNAKLRFVGSTESPDGAKDAAFADGADRIEYGFKPTFPSMVIMYMSAGYKKNSDARVRAHGYKPKYE